MINPEKQKEWTGKISDFEKSGKTKEVWCEKNIIGIRQLNYWIKRLTKNPSTENLSKQWLPIEIKEEEISEAPPLSVKIGLATVEVHPGFDKELLLEVLKILKAL